MSISNINGASGALAPQFTGGDQKPPIKKEDDKKEPTPSAIVNLGQVQEESPVYSPNFSGGDQKPPIK